MYNKWERAAKDAEETMDLTRSERLDCYLVTYGANQTKKIPAKSSPSVKNSKPCHYVFYLLIATSFAKLFNMFF